MTRKTQQIFACPDKHSEQRFYDSPTNPDWHPRCEVCRKPMVQVTESGKPMKISEPKARSVPVIEGQLSFEEAL